MHPSIERIAARQAAGRGRAFLTQHILRIIE